MKFWGRIIFVACLGLTAQAQERLDCRVLNPFAHKEYEILSMVSVDASKRDDAILVSAATEKPIRFNGGKRVQTAGGPLFISWKSVGAWLSVQLVGKKYRGQLRLAGQYNYDLQCSLKKTPLTSL